MPDFIVTIKMSKDPNHDPKNKITGECPSTGMECTDTTGEHHSFLHQAGSAEEIRTGLQALGVHVTRIEMVSGAFGPVSPHN